MTRVAIVAAFPAELKPLVRGWRRESRRGVDLWRWRRGDGVWIAACAGAGRDAATRAFAEIERDGAIDLAFSIGWAGALREEFAIGRPYRASEVVDECTGESFRAAGCFEECRLVTSCRVADPAEKRRLAGSFGAGLVDMEAVAVARLAANRGIPFYCIKGVSDGLADRQPDFNGFISPKGKFRLIRFIFYSIFRPWLWPSLLRLGKSSRQAAQGVGQFVLDVLEPLMPVGH